MPNATRQFLVPKNIGLNDTRYFYGTMLKPNCQGTPWLNYTLQSLPNIQSWNTTLMGTASSPKSCATPMGGTAVTNNRLQNASYIFDCFSDFDRNNWMAFCPPFAKYLGLPVNWNGPGTSSGYYALDRYCDRDEILYTWQQIYGGLVTNTSQRMYASVPQNNAASQPINIWQEEGVDRSAEWTKIDKVPIWCNLSESLSNGTPYMLNAGGYIPLGFNSSYLSLTKTTDSEKGLKSIYKRLSNLFHM